MFDIMKCVLGDELRTTNNEKVVVERLFLKLGTGGYPVHCSNGLTYTYKGTVYHNHDSEDDIIGLWEDVLVIDAKPPTITHNITIKGTTHVLTTEELVELWENMNKVFTAYLGK